MSTLVNQVLDVQKELNIKKKAIQKEAMRLEQLKGKCLSCEGKGTITTGPGTYRQCPVCVGSGRDQS